MKHLIKKLLREGLLTEATLNDISKSIYGLAKYNAGRWKSDKQKNFIMKFLDDFKGDDGWYSLGSFSSRATYGNSTSRYAKFDDGGVNKIKSVADKSGKVNITFEYTPELEGEHANNNEFRKIFKLLNEMDDRLKGLSDTINTTIKDYNDTVTKDFLKIITSTNDISIKTSVGEIFGRFTESIDDLKTPMLNSIREIHDSLPFNRMYYDVYKYFPGVPKSEVPNELKTKINNTTKIIDNLENDLSEVRVKAEALVNRFKEETT